MESFAAGFSQNLELYAWLAVAAVVAYYGLPYVGPLLAKVVKLKDKLKPSPEPEPEPEADKTSTADAVVAALYLHRYGCEHKLPDVCASARDLLPKLLGGAS